MDQYSHYLMLMNNKRHHLEQAFAEDANGPLGGFMWPPRNYSCTFCKREFRSAQALGGHMNVHRRDRAMLKQSPSLSPQNHEDSTSPDHHVICTSPSKFVASPPRESSFVSKQNNVPLYSSSHIISSKAQENEYMSNYVACKKSNMRKEDQSTFGSGLVDGYVETSLSVGLNFGVSSRTRPAGDDIGGEIKRKKTEDVFALPFLFKGCLNDKDTKIDLELRLGDSPVVR